MKRHQEDVFEYFAQEFVRRHREPGPLWLVERILVGTDFSLCSLSALEHAEELARRFAAGAAPAARCGSPRWAGGADSLAHVAAEREDSRGSSNLPRTAVSRRAASSAMVRRLKLFSRPRPERTRGPHRHGYPRAHGHDARAHGQRCSARGAQTRHVQSSRCGAARRARLSRRPDGCAGDREGLRRQDLLEYPGLPTRDFPQLRGSDQPRVVDLTDLPGALAGGILAKTLGADGVEIRDTRWRSRSARPAPYVAP